MRLFSRVIATVVLSAVALVGLAGTALAGDERAGEVSRTDAKWAAMMVPHHKDGIELAELALDKATSSGVKKVAREAKRDQEKELPRLRAIARAGGLSEQPPERPIRRFNDEQMKRLKALSGKDFDRYWLDVFRGHHMSAIMMTDTATAGTAGNEAKELQEQIHDGQLTQVDTMNRLRRELGGTSRA